MKPNRVTPIDSHSPQLSCDPPGEAHALLGFPGSCHRVVLLNI